MTTKSLLKQAHALSDQKNQLEILVGEKFKILALPSFSSQLEKAGCFPLRPSKLEIFQVNLGYMCNQTCSHCHVDAGPDRKEMMSRENLLECLRVLGVSGAHTLDITGGAPEMHPDFRWFVEQAVQLGVEDIIVRSNLTIIRSNKKYHDLPEFFAKNKVHVVSSLPFYKKERTDKQRGDGVFDRSIEALKMLNSHGYARPGSSLKLDLVYNPAGAFLPANQEALEIEYKKVLTQDYEVSFSRLLTITNLPVSRFLDYLLKSENYGDYMDTLVQAYNPATLTGLMCRNTISVSWDGNLYDCDFNQMLGLGVTGKSKNLSSFSVEGMREREIVVSQHCYGCTAGAGSGCQGALN